MAEDGLDVVALPRRATVQVAPPRVQFGQAGLALVVPRRARVLFDEVQLDVLRGHGPPGATVEVLEHADRARDLGRRAFDAELVAAPLDGDIERRFDLAQVAVERASQMRQMRVVAFGGEHLPLGGDQGLGSGGAGHGADQKKRRELSRLGSGVRPPQPLARTIVARNASLSASWLSA